MKQFATATTHGWRTTRKKAAASSRSVVALNIARRAGKSTLLRNARAASSATVMTRASKSKNASTLKFRDVLVKSVLFDFTRLLNCQALQAALSRRTKSTSK